MRIYKTLLLATLLLMMYSCGGDRVESVGTATLEYLRSTDQLEDFNHDKFGIIIIPGTACGSCIARTLENVSGNLELLSSSKLIFTNYTSMKGYRLKYGDGVFTHKNFIADRKGELYEYTRQVTAPTLLYYENQVPVRMEIIELKTVDVKFNDFNREFNAGVSEALLIK